MTLARHRPRRPSPGAAPPPVCSRPVLWPGGSQASPPGTVDAAHRTMLRPALGRHPPPTTPPMAAVGGWPWRGAILQHTLAMATESPTNPPRHQPGRLSQPRHTSPPNSGGICRWLWWPGGVGQSSTATNCAGQRGAPSTSHPRPRLPARSARRGCCTSGGAYRAATTVRPTHCLQSD